MTEKLKEPSLITPIKKENEYFIPPFVLRQYGDKLLESDSMKLVIKRMEHLPPEVPFE